MRTSLRLYTRAALVAVTLSITAFAVPAQSGRSKSQWCGQWTKAPQDRESLLSLVAPR